MGGGWPLQDWASGSAPGHLAGRVAAGTWCVVLSFTLKETGLCPTPRPGPGKQTVTGEKEAVVQGLIQILEAVGSKASPACSLSGLLTCYCPGPRASSSGPFCSSNTQSRPHQGLVLPTPVSRICFPKTLSGQDCPTPHTSAQSHLLRETSLMTRPTLSRCPALAVQ